MVLRLRQHNIFVAKVNILCRDYHRIVQWTKSNCNHIIHKCSTKGWCTAGNIDSTQSIWQAKK